MPYVLLFVEKTTTHRRRPGTTATPAGCVCAVRCMQRAVDLLFMNKIIWNVTEIIILVLQSINFNLRFIINLRHRFCQLWQCHAVLTGRVLACSVNNQNCQRRCSYNVGSRCLISDGCKHDVLPTILPLRSVTLKTRTWCYTMRTRSGSDYTHNTMPYCPPSQSTMEMDELDAAISSLDITGPLTTEHLAQLLRTLAKTITGKFDLLIAKKDSKIKVLNTRVSELEEKCDELEQYSRRNVIRIRGILLVMASVAKIIVQLYTKAIMIILLHCIVVSNTAKQAVDEETCDLLLKLARNKGDNTNVSKVLFSRQVFVVTTDGDLYDYGLKTESLAFWLCKYIIFMTRQPISTVQNAPRELVQLVLPKLNTVEEYVISYLWHLLSMYCITDTEYINVRCMIFNASVQLSLT